MERIRLLTSYIETSVDLNYLEFKGFVVAHFPIHNNWQLKGKENILQIQPTLEHLTLRSTLIDFKPLNMDSSLIAS